MSSQQPYIENIEQGDNWTAMLGDSCERLAEVKDESVDLSVYSPPFASLFTYSPSERDIGNCRDADEFLVHYGFVVGEMLRVTKPGRMSVVHCAQVPSLKWREGFVGLNDFRGGIIAAHVAAGWTYFGEVTVDKDPQIQALRTKAQPLMFQTLRKDASNTRPAMVDYLLIFRKPGENAVPIHPDIDNPTWIRWAHGVWYDIRETDTLNASGARENDDERHICPLQLGLIERVVRLWSNPGELVLSPFMGIGSEVHTAVRLGRRGLGCELKPTYWQTAVANLQALDLEMSLPSLFDEVAG
jgi:DNA modification methylase